MGYKEAIESEYEEFEDSINDLADDLIEGD